MRRCVDPALDLAAILLAWTTISARTWTVL
jgi:hypothetical protein